MSGYDEHDRTWPNVLAGRTLPYLEVLELGTEAYSHEPDWEKTLDVPILHTLSLDAPRPINASSLRALHADGGVWHWLLLLNFLKLYPHLEELTIESIFMDGDMDDDRFDVEDENITSLRNLVKRAERPSTLHLPHLKRFELSNFGWKAREFVRHLTYPPVVTLKLEGFREAKDVLKVMPRPEFCHPTRDILAIYDFRGWYNSQKINPHLSREPPPPHHNCVYVDTYTVGPSIIPDLLNAMPLDAASRMRELAFARDCDCDLRPCDGSFEKVDTERLAGSLLRFTALITLHLHRQGQNHDIFEILGTTYFESKVLFPALRTLVVSLESTVQKIWWEDLCDMLAARKAAGYPLARLVVRGAGACHNTYCVDADVASSSDDESESETSSCASKVGEGCLKTGGDNDTDTAREDTLQPVKAQPDLDHALEGLVPCKELRRITLDLEKQLVEVVDERDGNETCKCEDYCPDCLKRRQVSKDTNGEYALPL